MNMKMKMKIEMKMEMIVNKTNKNENEEIGKEIRTFYFVLMPRQQRAKKVERI